MYRQDQWKTLDNLRRKFFIKYELRSRLLNSIKVNSRVPLAQRHYAQFQQNIIPRKAYITKPRNRCVVSGRQYNTISKTKHSRFVLRFTSYKGVLPGLRRASW